MPTVTLARHAMATRFEIVLHGENSVALRASGEEALDEIERLEAQLSLYCRTSEISCLNAHASAGPVRVEPTLFRLLQRAQRLSQETEGAFDITVAPLLRCWGFLGGTGRLADPGELAEARRKAGFHHLILNEADFTVQFDCEGVMLDLGLIGKGYALEKAAELLVEGGITSAFLHGGTSTAYALGTPPDAEAWKVAVQHPPADRTGSVPNRHAGIPEDHGSPPVLAVVSLKDEAFSVSAVWGKSFAAEGRVYGHVIDPRLGEPVPGALLAAVASPSAADTDALSTALLVLGRSGHEKISKLREGVRTLLVEPSEEPGGFRVEAKGISLRMERPGLA